MAQRATNTTRSDPSVIVTYGPVIAAVSGVILGVYATYKASQLQTQVDELKKQLQALQQQVTNGHSQINATLLNHRDTINGTSNKVLEHEKVIKKVRKVLPTAVPVSSHSMTAVPARSVDLLGDIDMTSSSSTGTAAAPSKDAQCNNSVDDVISRLNKT